jgi:hypothetical protein
VKGEFRPCREHWCEERVAFLRNPKTGRTVPICDLHMQNHFRCCANPGRFSRPRRDDVSHPPRAAASVAAPFSSP